MEIEFSLAICSIQSSISSRRQNLPSATMPPIFLLVCLLPGYSEGARILAVFPLPSSSHYFFALPYLKSLAFLGHEITSVSPYPQREPFRNIHDIPVPEVFENFNGEMR